MSLLVFKQITEMFIQHHKTNYFHFKRRPLNPIQKKHVAKRIYNEPPPFRERWQLPPSTFWLYPVVNVRVRWCINAIMLLMEGALAPQRHSVLCSTQTTALIWRAKYSRIHFFLFCVWNWEINMNSLQTFRFWVLQRNHNYVSGHFEDVSL